MKAIGSLSLSVLAALLLLAPPARAADIPTCTKEQLLALTPTPSDVATHRQFPVPFVSYPFETKMENWGFTRSVWTCTGRYS